MMKVLFVCRYNAVRSQIAEAIFNSISKRNRAYSAGVNVRSAGTEGMPVPEETAALMKGYDLSKAKRKQLTSEMAESMDRIIVLIPKEEQNILPDYIKNSTETIYWPMEHIGVAQREQEEQSSRVRHIKDKVTALVKEIG